MHSGFLSVLEVVSAGPGWRSAAPGIHSRGDGACSGLNVCHYLPPWFWPAPVVPVHRSRGVRVNPGGSSGAVLLVWVEEGLLVQKGEAADVGLVWLESMCLILLEVVCSCAAWHQAPKALSVTGRPQGDLLLWFLFALPGKCFASCQRSRQDGSEKKKTYKCNAGQLRSLPQASGVSGVPLCQAWAGGCRRDRTNDCWASAQSLLCTLPTLTQKAKERKFIMEW